MRNRQTAFTLVELMIVMSIIAIVGALTVVVLRGAVENANRSRTQTLVTKINSVLRQRWDEYEVRILPLRLDDSYATAAAPNNVLTRQQVDAVRRNALLDLVRIEMLTDPDLLANYPTPEFSAGWTNIPLSYLDSTTIEAELTLRTRPCSGQPLHRTDWQLRVMAAGSTIPAIRRRSIGPSVCTWYCSQSSCWTDPGRTFCNLMKWPIPMAMAPWRSWIRMASPWSL